MFRVPRESLRTWREAALSPGLERGTSDESLESLQSPPSIKNNDELYLTPNGTRREKGLWTPDAVTGLLVSVPEPVTPVSKIRRMDTSLSISSVASEGDQGSAAASGNHRSADLTPRRHLIGLRVSGPMDLHDRDCGILVGGCNYMKDVLVERPKPYALSAGPQAASTRVAIK